MKVVMDFRKYDGVVGGVEQRVIQVTRSIMTHGHSVVLLCKRNKLDEVRRLFDENSSLKIVPLNVATHIINRKNTRLDSTTIQDIAEEEKADIIHFPYNWSFPYRKKIPSVLTVHDVIPFTFREAQGFLNNRLKYKPGIRKACRLNDVIVTVSEFSRKDIAKKTAVPLQKIRVIYNGLREPNRYDRRIEDDLRKRFGIEGRFILNVGGIHERKNILRLIRAFSLLVNRRGYPGKLVITGKVTGAFYQKKMKRRCDRTVADVGMETKVVFTDFISERELDTLLRLADFLIYPSLYEGFGIPVLEAMRVGLPVITSNTTALPEIAGDSALLIDPEDIEDMTTKMAELLEDESLREQLKRKGLERSKQFTWEKTSQEYLALYREVLQKQQRLSS